MSQTSSLQEAWDTVIDELDAQSIGSARMAIIRLTKPLGILDDTILLAVPDDFTKSFIENRISDLLTTALSRAVGTGSRFAVTVDPSLKTNPGITRQLESNLPSPTISSNPISTNNSHEINESSALPTIHTRLNPKYTFETFVIGSSNRFAHAAANAVAESPARAYNPLFIYGGSGLGKTHLLHAIGHYALNLYPHLQVKYVNSEQFTNDFINAIRDDRAEEFQRRYRQVDILLIDDIQFIQGKEQTVEEFFYTFNSLHDANKQVVITSDLPPKQLDVEDRLRSRFEWGLLTDVQPPDLETRIAIMRKKAQVDQLQVPDEVLEYIASRITTNIRELEGALIRVTAFANLTNQPVDGALAGLILKDIISDPNDEKITSSLIMSQTADYFGISVEDLCSADRSRTIVEARQIAMYLCRELTDLSLPKIGQSFGGRDHTTVMHANKKITREMTKNPQIFNHVTEMTSRIKNKARER